MTNNTSNLSSVILVSLLSVSTLPAIAATLSPQELLGKKLFNDKKLSEPKGQACSSCYLKAVGFDDPDKRPPVSGGVISGLFGGRNSPTAAYAMYSPNFHFNQTEGLWKGGLFLDSRATGNTLGDPLADQALEPFLNPVEMANTSKVTVVRDASQGGYEELFSSICGNVNLSSNAEVDAAYNCIATSIASFERTRGFARFNSK